MFEDMQFFDCNNVSSSGNASMKKSESFFEMKIKMKCSTATLLITLEHVLQFSV